MKESPQKKLEFMFKLLFLTTMFAIIQEVLLSLNNEIFIPNWLLGTIFTIIFGTLYMVNLDVFFIKSKRFHKFMLFFWISWIVASQIDNLTNTFLYIIGGVI